MGRVKQCELWESKIEEGIWGRRVNTKDSSKGHMTTYSYRSLLKYIHMLICKKINGVILQWGKTNTMHLHTTG